MKGQRERVRGQSRELLYSIPTALCEESVSAVCMDLIASSPVSASPQNKKISPGPRRIIAEYCLQPGELL